MLAAELGQISAGQQIRDWLQVETRRCSESDTHLLYGYAGVLATLGKGLSIVITIYTTEWRNR